MGMTIAEKVLASHAGLAEVKPGQIVMANIDRVRINDGFGSYFEKNFEELGVDRFWDADRVVLAIEHQVPPSTVPDAEEYAASRRLAKKFGIKHFYEMGRAGICHAVFIEEGFARPGELVVANDSHSCIYGALNCVSRGIGGAEMAYVLVYGKLWFKVPETVKIIIDGTLPRGVYSKDIMLYIAGTYGADVARYCSVEFEGSTVDAMSMEARITMANMGIEIGAKFAMFNADEKIISYVGARTDERFEPVRSDPDAEYKRIIRIDATKLVPYVACPFELSNSKPISEVEGTKVDQVFIGSCANGYIEDLRIAAAVLSGKRIADDTRLIVIPASMRVYKQAMHEGLFDVFLDAGAIIDGPTCGPCGGGGKGVLAAGERCMSTTNRNFRGRMGSAEAEVYLGSPAMAAATAIHGVITDPRKYEEVL